MACTQVNFTRKYVCKSHKFSLENKSYYLMLSENPWFSDVSTTFVLVLHCFFLNVSVVRPAMFQLSSHIRDKQLSMNQWRKHYFWSRFTQFSVQYFSSQSMNVPITFMHYNYFFMSLSYKNRLFLLVMLVSRWGIWNIYRTLKINMIIIKSIKYKAKLNLS